MWNTARTQDVTFADHEYYALIVLKRVVILFRDDRLWTDGEIIDTGSGRFVNWNGAVPEPLEKDINRKIAETMDAT